MRKQETRQWEVKVKENQANLIEYAAKAFPILGSKSAVKKAIVKQQLKINGKVANFKDRLKKGDTLKLEFRAQAKSKVFDVKLEVVYEDDHLLIVNKPGGIAVNGNRNKTVENAMAQSNRELKLEGSLPQPVAVHRIDVPTNGLVLLARTKQALIKCSKAFQQNQVKKEYVAIVHGKTPSSGKIDEAVQGKKAITYFETIETAPSRVFEHLSLVRMEPHTGRTHQLRLHMKNRGHLIVGDKMYADGQKTILGKGLMLCARKLEFKHPISGQTLSVEIEIPTKFTRILKREKERFSA